LMGRWSGSGGIGPLYLRPSKRDGGAFSLPLHEVDDTERRHVAMYRDKKRKPLFLLGRESTV
jgi:hypothetical protein